MKTIELLAILGRGIQRLAPDGPWVLTEDLEVCDERSAHLPVRVPADDENPYCMGGGGEMNLEAGNRLVWTYNPLVVVCAYGDRSDYLKSVDGPTESEVMSDTLRGCLRIDHENGWVPWRKAYSLPQIVVWPRSRSMTGPSNTGRELLNVFELAVERNFTRIGVVTVGVHLPRTATYVARHLCKPEFQHLYVRVFESEEVLLAADPSAANRVHTMRNSQAFARTWEREMVGISKVLRDVYGDNKPPVLTS